MTESQNKLKRVVELLAADFIEHWMLDKRSTVYPETLKATTEIVEKRLLPLLEAGEGLHQWVSPGFGKEKNWYSEYEAALEQALKE